MKLHDMRKEFGSQLDYQLELAEDPFEAFKSWFQEAQKLYKEEANCFVLSTVSGQGVVNSRILLLKSFDKESFSFFTNYGSSKAQEIEENSSVSCLFYWSTIEKQIRINGKAEKLTQEESESYFRSRPRNSQIAAWASKQSESIDSKKNLIEKFLEYKEKFSQEEEIPYPEFWGGYKVIPSEFEYWQGGLYRLHDRIRYKKKEKIWSQSRLSP